MTEKVQPVKRKTKKSKDTFYIDPNKFRDAIVKFYATGDFSEELGEFVYLLCKRVGNNTSWINYTYNDELVQEAILKVSRVLIRKKYDPYRGNAFSYFSMVAINTIKNGIKQADKKETTLGMYQSQMYEELVHSNIIDVNDDSEANEW